MSGELHAVRPGPLVTVQDLGRPGFQRFGVAEGGVMDRRSHCIGAGLLGQSPSLASLEMAAMGGVFRSGADSVRIVVTGAPMPLVVAGRRHVAGTVVQIPPNTEFEIGAPPQAVFAYLSVLGGVDTDPVLGSRSTHVRSAIGGLHGRAIQADDVIRVGGSPAVVTPPTPYTLPSFESSVFRIVWGLHADVFSVSVRARLIEEEFEVTDHRDRMGMRLEASSSLLAPGSLSLPSSPVVDGDIQIPGDGHPVVLLADRQPTGGYPRIATIVEADRDRFAQQSSGASVRFRRVSFEEATSLLLAYRDELAALANLEDRPLSDTPRALWLQNLISGFTVGEQEAD